jgi:NADH-quinone oxidoreductase subunit G
MCNALRLLGFDHVFDTNFAADLTIWEETAELLARLQKGDGEKLPLFTSCCPGWVNYLEIHRPDLLPHLSPAKSPQQMLGAVAKHGPFAKGLQAEGQPAPYVVSVMPCTAKKDEALRPDMAGDVDAVLTTRELARMIRSRKLPFASLSAQGQFDSPLGESTGAAQLFGASGGVMEAALRAAARLLKLPEPQLEYHAVRGVGKELGVKEADVEGVGRVAVVNGIANAIKLLSNDEWKQRYIMVEVMACVGGCLGGGGEPKSLDPDILSKRARAIYSIDEASIKRNSLDNVEVEALYTAELGAPQSEKAKKLLHTSYHAR